MIKLVFFYNQYDAGWSETYYVAGSDPKLFAGTLTKQFLQNSVAFRSASTVLKAVRCTRIEPPRFAFLLRPYPSPQGQRAFASGEGPDVTSTDAVIQLNGQIGASRRVFMRGLYDADVQRDSFGVDFMGPILSKGINLFVAGLMAYGTTIRYLTRPPGGGLVWQSLFNIAASDFNPFWTSFILDPAIPAHAVGDTLSFTNIPSTRLPGFPRTAKIIRISVDAGILKYSINYALPGGVAPAPRGLRCTTLLPAFDPIIDWQFGRFSEHKTGRPFGSLRGRAKSRSVRA